MAPHPSWLLDQLRRTLLAKRTVLKDATLNAQLDMDELNAVPVGGTAVIDVEGALSLIGTSIDVEAEMFVARISDTQVMVTTNDIV